MIYLDSNYIAKCYLREQGTAEVLKLVQAARVRSSCMIALTEVQAALHRHLREGRLQPADYTRVSSLLDADVAAGVWNWIPVSDSLLRQARNRFLTLPPRVFLRSTDCLHLCAAVSGGFTEIHSNDRHLLAAAPLFGLTPVNVIP
jgi:predicted nucleic acid-binding protein